jgi:hypothetical protein
MLKEQADKMIESGFMKKVKILGASPEAFMYAGGFERLDERSKLQGIGPASE